MRVRLAEVSRDDRRYQEVQEEVSARRALLAGIVDYAGLFPPAALDMRAAVRNYATYLAAPDRWMLGRFVVPVARLNEFELERRDVGGHASWPLSALLGADAAGDVERVRKFNAEFGSRATVDTLEGKLSTREDIARVAEAATPDLDLFVEIPLDGDPSHLIAAARDAGVKAKMRTGGVAAAQIPTAAAVVRFMRACLDAGVPFKATAGLHHPVRAEYRLTYEADAPVGTMFGYLNVFVAAAFLSNGATDDDAIRTLEERDVSAFEIGDDVVRWRGRVLDATAVQNVRERVATSFGSCSFREPVDELQAIATH
jgi:hypothetical protein